MGDLIGGIIGGIGSIVGGNAAAKKEDEAAKTALTGYNYLNTNPLINQAQTSGAAGLTGEGATNSAISSLLTSPSQNNPAYQNYLNSTGYNFQLQQGTDAITGNAAAKGLLNSGATGKALTAYGQNLASTTFGNYLSQLSGLSGLQSNQANQGLQAASTVGAAGTQGGANAGNFQAQAGQSEGTSITNAFNTVGGSVGAGMNNGSIGNFFSTPATSALGGPASSDAGFSAFVGL